MAARVQLVTREGCHLCADAREVVRRVLGEPGEPAKPGAAWEELDVDDPGADPAFRAAHTDWVPVLLLDGAVLDSFRIDEQRLRAAVGTGSPHRRRWRPW